MAIPEKFPGVECACKHGTPYLNFRPKSVRSRTLFSLYARVHSSNISHLFFRRVARTEDRGVFSTVESENVMPGVMFQQCSCGMEMKILYLVADTKQFYTCT